MTALRMVALVPARSGSKRIPGKNTRALAGKPLLSWTILQAQQARCFDDVYVSTESPMISAIATAYGAKVHNRDFAHAQDDSPDIDWVRPALKEANCDAFCLLRPTSPFRTPSTIAAACAMLLSRSDIDSLRAVRKCRERPEKMWVSQPDGCMAPLNYASASKPYQALEAAYGEVWVQDSSLEVAWSWPVVESGLLSGRKVAPWQMPGHEGFSIDWDDDWIMAEALLANGTVKLEAS